MPDTRSAREAVLSRVRGIVGEARSTDAVAAEWNSLSRAYRVETGLDETKKLDLLIERLHDYDAVVYRVAAEEVAAAIRSVLEPLGVREVLGPPGLEPSWLPGKLVPGGDTILAAEEYANNGPHGDRLVFVEDRGFAPHELDRFTAVLTASTLAIAETGTLVLQNLPGQGRRAATLVPDVHLCIVREADVVHTVPEAMRRLQGTADLPTTFISGPSATADIEMTRIKGVHGPRFLHVLLLR